MHKTYIKESDGDTAVLFIHGFLGSPEHFKKLIEIVSTDVSVYNILLNGHGGSVLDFGKASMESWKKQIDEVVCTLNEKYQNIYIVSHSMGTFFAMEQAIKYPDKVKGLILLQTPLKIGVKPRAAINTFKSFFDIFKNDKVASAYKNAHSVKLNFRVWEYITWIPRYIELFHESKAARNTILKLKTPCTIFQSEKDELVSMKSVSFIPKNENIKLYILKNSAHFIYDTEDEKIINNAFCKMISEAK